MEVDTNEDIQKNLEIAIKDSKKIFETDADLSLCIAEANILQGKSAWKMFLVDPDFGSKIAKIILAYIADRTPRNKMVALMNQESLAKNLANLATKGVRNNETPEA